MSAPKTSFNRRFASKKEEVARSIRNLGISGTMEFYNIKSRQHFISWLRNNLNGELDISPLSDLSNGEKGFWYRQNRDFILTCLEIFDRDFVLKSFTMGEDTLDRLLNSSTPGLDRKLTRLERAEFDAKEALRLARETAKQVNTFIERFAIISEDRRQETGILKEIRQAHTDFVQDVAGCLGMEIETVIRAGLNKRLVGVRRLLPLPKPKITDILPPEVEPKIAKETKVAYLSAHPFSKGEEN